MAEEEEDKDQLDPRIQIELEKLNSSTDVINKLELDLEEARSQFRHLLNDSTRRLDSLAKDIGPTCVDRSRSYYEARMVARRALAEAQHAAARFEKASSAHEAAKEMVTLAEEGFAEKGMQFDQAWQEMLNHATNRVNESEKEKIDSAEEHKQKSKAYQRSEKKVHDLERSLRKPIRKSRPYFDLKAKFNQRLDDQKRQVQLIEETIQMTKMGYADSLKELEKISEEIHERRQREQLQQQLRQKQQEDHHHQQQQLGERGEGVGAESPDDDEGEDEEQEDVGGKEGRNAGGRSSLGNSSQVKRPSALPSSVTSSIPTSISLDLSKQQTTHNNNSSSTTTRSSHRPRDRMDSLPSKDSSNTASTSNSPSRTPCYEQLLDDEDEDENVKSSSSSEGCATANDLKDDEDEDEEEGKQFGRPNLLFKGVARLAVADNDADDASDSESLASMEMIDDETLEKLMMDNVVVGGGGDLMKLQQHGLQQQAA